MVYVCFRSMGREGFCWLRRNPSQESVCFDPKPVLGRVRGGQSGPSGMPVATGEQHDALLVTGTLAVSLGPKSRVETEVFPR